jgi:hypothetical protein
VVDDEGACDVDVAIVGSALAGVVDAGAWAGLHAARRALALLAER